MVCAISVICEKIARRLAGWYAPKFLRVFFDIYIHFKEVFIMKKTIANTKASRAFRVLLILLIFALAVSGHGL